MGVTREMKRELVESINDNIGGCLNGPGEDALLRLRYGDLLLLEEQTRNAKEHIARELAEGEEG